MKPKKQNGRHKEPVVRPTGRLEGTRRLEFMLRTRGICGGSGNELWFVIVTLLYFRVYLMSII